MQGYVAQGGEEGKEQGWKSGNQSQAAWLVLDSCWLTREQTSDHAHSHIIFNHSISRLNAPASSQRTQRLFVIGLHFFLLRFYVHPSPFLSPWRCHGWIQTPVSLIDSFFLFVSYRGKCFRSIALHARCNIPYIELIHFVNDHFTANILERLVFLCCIFISVELRLCVFIDLRLLTLIVRLPCQPYMGDSHLRSCKYDNMIIILYEPELRLTRIIKEY